MKKYCVLTLVIMLITYDAQAQTLKDIDWLVGKWRLVSAKPGHSGVEIWKRISLTEFSGKGVSLSGTDTVFVEKLSIVMKDNTLYYVADVPENKQKVYFKISHTSDHGFVCENQAHDFPKKISYALEGKKLRATISGDGKQIDYFFEKAD